MLLPKILGAEEFVGAIFAANKQRPLRDGVNYLERGSISRLVRGMLNERAIKSFIRARRASAGQRNVRASTRRDATYTSDSRSIDRFTSVSGACLPPPSLSPRQSISIYCQHASFNSGQVTLYQSYARVTAIILM